MKPIKLFIDLLLCKWRKNCSFVVVKFFVDATRSPINLMTDWRNQLNTNLQPNLLIFKFLFYFRTRNNCSTIWRGRSEFFWQKAGRNLDEAVEIIFNFKREKSIQIRKKLVTFHFFHNFFLSLGKKRPSIHPFI